MPFFGSDWRAPGNKWIRTEFGWKRLSEIHSTLQRQIGKAAKRSVSVLRSRSGSPGNTTCNSSRGSSRASSPDKGKGNHCKLTSGNRAGTVTFDERRWRRHRLCLAQRCISARGSSRESNQYATISDAISKLNFSQALLDANCYPFICKVIERLYEDRYWTLSGSMQTTLLRLTSAAKDIAIESRQQTGYILSLIEKQIFALEKGREKMMTGFTVSRLDAKIKSILTSRAQLVGELQKAKCVKVPYLPDDCWRLIIGFLDQPQDVLSLGCVNSTLHSLTSECPVWRSLAEYHYGRVSLMKDK
ncbi:F-box only protein 25 [Geodia barretti]|uniref:F-box only protein 25 n=1 Tax=Geodia barretti TaxID=519541 RepID=A0AA35X1H4_GEOBA|nr:F-box only protein 25 [Geodia barretti]